MNAHDNSERSSKIRGWRLQVTAAVLLVGLGLGGCGAESVRSLRKMPDTVYSCEVPADYEVVYERLVRRVRQRYALTNRTTYQPVISARLFPAQQAAGVSLANGGGIGLCCLLHADIRRLGAARTRVDIYCATAAYDREARHWQLWANTPLPGG